MSPKWYHEWPYPDLAMYALIVVVLGIIGAISHG